MRRVFPDLAGRWHLIYQLWGYLARDRAAGERLFRTWRAFYEEREERIASTIAAGQESGRFRRDVDPRAHARLQPAIFDGLLHRATFDAAAVDPEAELQATLRFLGGTLLTEQST